jgi:hypothetical protein
MAPDYFATLIFKGGRFQGAAMPLEALPELAAYRDLVLAVAKAVWQREHQDRQRLPNGFERGFRLVMVGVQEGSTVPLVARAFEGQTSLIPHVRDIFDGARDLVEKAIACGTTGADLPSDFPLDAVPRFAAFGQTLDDATGEHMLVGPPGAKTGHRYDRGVRKRILLWKQATYEDAVTLVGEVRSADKDTEGFWLRTQDGEKVQVHAPPLFFPVALESLSASAQVRVRGTGLFDRDGVLQKRAVSAIDVSLAEEGESGGARAGSCPTAVEAQVESLRALGPGWFDAESLALSGDGLGWLSSLLVQFLPGFELPTPYLYPTPEGHVRAEWSARRWDVYAEFDLAKHEVSVLASRVDSDEVGERQLDLGVPGAETQLGRFLADHMK